MQTQEVRAPSHSLNAAGEYSQSTVRLVLCLTSSILVLKNKCGS